MLRVIVWFRHGLALAGGWWGLSERRGGGVEREGGGGLGVGRRGGVVPERGGERGMRGT